MKKPSLISRQKGFLLGKNERNEYVYLERFKWDCNWYWGGGYLSWYRQNRSWCAHTHFSGLEKYEWYDFKKDCHRQENMHFFDGFKKHISVRAITDNQIWRLCDLMKQFYAMKEAAECFQYGGHMTSEGRNPAEINKDMAHAINKHIENVIIPEVYKIFEKEPA